MSKNPYATAARGTAGRLTLAAVLACGTASAEEAGGGVVELWLADAPLARVLEQIAGTDGVDVVVGDDVDARVDGRLDGRRETVLAALAVEHGLSVHAEGDTVWFDREDRPVVSLVRLSPSERTTALAALEPTLAAPGVVQGTDEGIVMSGSRAFVEGVRRRVATLVVPATETSPTREVRSVWDIPGYDVDYTAGSAS